MVNIKQVSDNSVIEEQVYPFVNSTMKGTIQYQLTDEPFYFYINDMKIPDYENIESGDWGSEVIEKYPIKNTNNITWYDFCHGKYYRWCQAFYNYTWNMFKCDGGIINSEYNVGGWHVQGSPDLHYMTIHLDNEDAPPQRMSDYIIHGAHYVEKFDHCCWPCSNE